MTYIQKKKYDKQVKSIFIPSDKIWTKFCSKTIAPNCVEKEWIQSLSFSKKTNKQLQSSNQSIVCCYLFKEFFPKPTLIWPFLAFYAYMDNILILWFTAKSGLGMRAFCSSVNLLIQLPKLQICRICNIFISKNIYVKLFFK